MSEDDCDNDNCDNGPNMFLTMCPLWSLTGDKLHGDIFQENVNEKMVEH